MTIYYPGQHYKRFHSFI